MTTAVLETPTSTYRPYRPEVRLFATSEGEPVALDRRTVGFVRGERTGTLVGIKISGMGDRWFTAPVNTPEGLFFSGFSQADANPDIGDSAITETFGIGGAAMVAAPGVTRFVGASGGMSAATDIFHSRKYAQMNSDTSTRKATRPSTARSATC